MSKFHKTTIVVTILSEGPYDPESLGSVADDISFGDCSGVWTVTSSEELTRKEAAKALLAQGSDPEFFGIAEDDESLDD